MNVSPLQWLRRRPLGWAAAAVIAVYLVTAAAYAIRTPMWEAPDEPAHYNYIRSVASGRLPVLQPGDYPYDYLEELKAERFPPTKSVDSLRYESWQPPLYYLSAAPLLWLSQGLPLTTQLILLRLFTVALGALTLWLTYRLGVALFPREPAVALLALGVAATVPMHVAMAAAVNNDAPGELFLVWASLLLIRALGETELNTPADRRRLLVLGVVLGLGLLTKNTAAIGVALTALVIAGQAVTRRMRLREVLSRGACAFLPTTLLAAPWYARNAAVYGGLDILAWARHDTVVLFQPRTAEWLAGMGWSGLLREFALTTFRSFWAQFGWMGVLVDSRIYLALAALSAVILVGLAFFLLRMAVNRSALTTAQWHGLALLGAWIGLAVMVYLGYNVRFVQHQGRYLFPAMPAIAVGAALGWREALRPTRARFLAVLGLLAIAVALAGGLAWGAPLRTLIPLLVVGALGSALAWRLGERAAAWGQAALYLGLLALDYVCLVRFIIPVLRG